MSCRAIRMLEPIPVSDRWQGNILDGWPVHCRDSKNLQNKTLSTPDSHPLKLLIQIMFARSPHIHPLAPSYAHFVFLKTIYNNNQPEVNLPVLPLTHWVMQARGKFTCFYICFRWRNASKNTRPSDPRTSSLCNCSTKLIRCRRDRHQTAIDTLEELSGAVSVLRCRGCCIFIAT